MSSLGVRPLHDNIVVRRSEVKEVTAGGIVLTGVAAELPAEGEVLAVGNGKRLENGIVVPVDVQVGDKVLFGKYTGTEISVNNEKLLVLPESEIIGVVE